MPIHRLEAVTVCLNYADFLEHTIRHNQAHFDDWVVVTMKEDKDTRTVCDRYGVRNVFCPHITRGDSAFNKALAINQGLASLGGKEWTVHLDADTILPRSFRRHVNNVDLRTDCLYGIDRVTCPSYDEWMKYQTRHNPYEKGYFVHPPGDWRVGTRLSHFDYGGYVPIGFFQLWHADSGITRYPTVQTMAAEHTDVQHGIQWARDKRVLLPEVYAIHIGSENAGMGSNWWGRKTKPFGPAKLNLINHKGELIAKNWAGESLPRIGTSSVSTSGSPATTSPEHDAEQRALIAKLGAGYAK
jgi:hypothetical protein